MFSPGYGVMAYSALINNVFEALNLLTIFLFLDSRNSDPWPWHFAPLARILPWLAIEDFRHIM
jgi:hypothetical protein